MHMNFQFSLSFLFLLSYAVAVSLSRSLGQWTLLFLLQPILIWMVVSVLQQGFPRTVRKASSENVYRLDGSRSARRAAREQGEWRRVRLALYAVSLNATFSIDWLILLINSEMMEGRLTLNYLPWIAIVVGSWLFFTMFFVRVAYLGIVGEFYRGVRLRKEDYFVSDVGRLHERYDGANQGLHQSPVKRSRAE